MKITEASNLRNMTSRSLLSPGVLRRLDWISFAALFGVVLIFTLLNPSIGYDAWAYHLPFSSFLFNIGGGESTYKLCRSLELVYAGFPVGAEFLQGLAWKLTGSLRYIVIPHFVMLAALVIWLARRFTLSPTFLFVFLASCPLILLHITGQYNDMMVGICATAAVAFSALILLNPAGERSRLPWAGLTLSLLACNLIKFQGTLTALSIIASLTLVLLFQKQLSKAVIVGVLICGLASAAWQFKNLVEFNNPFYPLKVELAGHTLFDGPTPAYKNEPQYKPHLRPYFFFTSATEMDWIIRGVVPEYGLAMGTGDTAKAYGPARTGGFGQAFFVLNLLLLLVQWGMRSRLDPLQRALLTMVTLVVGFTSFMPQSHELRYWLVVPMAMSLLNVRFVASMALGVFSSVSALALLLVIGLYGSWPYMLSSRWRDWGSPEKFTNRDATPKVVEYDFLLDFQYSKAVTGQNIVMQPSYDGCR